MRKMYVGSAIVIGAAFGGWVHAGDLVANGGFETGTPGSAPSGNAWSFAPGGGDAGIAAAVSNSFPHSNTPAHGQVGYAVDDGSFSQSIQVTTAGSYHLSFDAEALNTDAVYDPGSIEATLVGPGVNLTIFTQTLSSTWKSFPFPAANLQKATYVVTFVQDVSDPSGSAAALVDNVSIPTLTPEPGTATLLATAAAGTLLRRRRR